MPRFFFGSLSLSFLPPLPLSFSSTRFLFLSILQLSQTPSHSLSVFADMRDCLDHSLSLSLWLPLARESYSCLCVWVCVRVCVRCMRRNKRTAFNSMEGPRLAEKVITWRAKTKELKTNLKGGEEGKEAYLTRSSLASGWNRFMVFLSFLVLAERRFIYIYHLHICFSALHCTSLKKAYLLILNISCLFFIFPLMLLCVKYWKHNLY
jgi:hypothetical protein